MRIKNAGLLPTATAFGRHASGDPFLAIIIKGTFRIESCGEPARVASVQLPILKADVPYDHNQPGGLLRFETDFVPFKPRADIILIGDAHAPRGRPTRHVPVLIRVGHTEKQLLAIGDREWRFRSLSDNPVQTEAHEFTRMPLTYDRAFGGIDEHAKASREHPKLLPWCTWNSWGRGFIGSRSVESINGKPLPNIEDPTDLIRKYDTQPRPAGCGFYPRNGSPRTQYLGTYDEKWRTEQAPRLPLDFRFDYHNAAHPDLQVRGYLVGDELVKLSNVTPGGGTLSFSLPGIEPQVEIHTSQTPSARSVPARLDTVVFIPEREIFYQVWRGVVPVWDSHARDVREIRVGYEQLQSAH